jgi:hypothetical protein
MTRRRLLAWAIVVVLALLASRLLAQRLASQDPIAEVLLGRAGTTLPLAGAVLVLRLGVIVGLPVFASMAAVGAAVRRMQREKESNETKTKEKLP